MALEPSKPPPETFTTKFNATRNFTQHWMDNPNYVCTENGLEESHWLWFTVATASIIIAVIVYSYWGQITNVF